MSDQSPASWLSSAQLLGVFFLSLRLGQDGTLPRGLSYLLSAGMLVLALDENFMLHEQWKYGCAAWLLACKYGWVRELPILAVGTIGFLAVVLLMRKIPERLPRAVLSSGLAIGLLAIFVDLTELPKYALPFEEVLEVISEALFLGGLLISGGNPQVHSAALSYPTYHQSPPTFTN